MTKIFVDVQKTVERKKQVGIRLKDVVFIFVKGYYKMVGRILSILGDYNRHIHTVMNVVTDIQV